MANRLDVRLYSTNRRRLEDFAEENGVPISDVVRRLIDDASQDILRTRRKQTVDRLIGLNAEDPPEPDTFSRELEASHETVGLHRCQRSHRRRRQNAEDVNLAAELVDQHHGVSTRDLAQHGGDATAGS